MNRCAEFYDPPKWYLAAFNRAAVFLCALLIVGCVSPKLEITYEPDRYGVPSPVVNGERYEMTEAERLKIGQAFVNEYCAAQ